MGYTTEFTGSFAVTPALKPEHSAYLHNFSHTRRMLRDASIAERLSDPVRIAAQLPIGGGGAYFVGGTGLGGEYEDQSVIDPNSPPPGQPELWCQWVPNEDGTAIEWDKDEKFYKYVEWLEYLIVHFLGPWGYTLDGKVAWSGEDINDHGQIYVCNNRVEAVPETGNSTPGPAVKAGEGSSESRRPVRADSRPSR